MSLFRRHLPGLRAGLALGAIAVMVTVGICFQRELRDFLVDDTKYLPEIKAAAWRHGLDWRLVRAVVFQESRFDPDTLGGAGEVGLMQVLPGGAVADWSRAKKCPAPSVNELRDVELNLEIGCFYLAKGMKRWQGYRCRTELALCQYNAGESRAVRWKPKAADGEISDNITIGATRVYVERIMKRYRHYCRQEEGRR